MTEKIFLKRRQQQRDKPLLTTRTIVRLMIFSVVIYGAFVFYVGEPGGNACVGGSCEAEYSLTIWVLAFLGLVGSMVVAGALVGTLIAYMRRGRHKSLSLIADEMAKNPIERESEREHRPHIDNSRDQ